MRIDRAFLFNSLSLLCGIWFLLTGWLWTYLANLFIAYPIAFIGILFWYIGRRKNPRSLLNKIALGILVAGFVVSIVAFCFFK